MGSSQSAELANHYGNIYIKTDLSEYFPGQRVNGNIFLNLMKTYPGSTLYLQLEGREFCQWTNREVDNPERMKRRKNRGPKGKKDIYSHQIAIYSFGGQYIPIGQYSFPFAFDLEKNLPSSFIFQNRCMDGIISYKIMGLLKSGEPKKIGDMLHAQPLQIIQGPIENYAPLKKDLSMEAKILWFFKRGNTKFECKLTKNNFVSGELCKVMCSIDNKDCKSEVSTVELNLLRKILLTSNKGKKKSKTFNLYKTEKSLFIPENLPNVVDFEFTFKLFNGDNSPFHSTSIGSMVKNFYYLKFVINYNNFGSNSFKSILPIVIQREHVNNQPNMPQIQAPMNWNPQVMPVQNISFVRNENKEEEEKGDKFDYPKFDQSVFLDDIQQQIALDKKNKI